jgi:hypothetical protein
MEMNITSGYVSADGHVVEPADLWVTRMDKRFRDRAPRLDSRPEGNYYLIDGLPPIPLGLEGAMVEDKIKGEIKSIMGHRHGDTRPGAWDPQPRLVDQEMDHVRAEVIYPGIFGLHFFARRTPSISAHVSASTMTGSVSFVRRPRIACSVRPYYP